MCLEVTQPEGLPPHRAPHTWSAKGLLLVFHTCFAYLSELRVATNNNLLSHPKEEGLKTTGVLRVGAIPSIWKVETLIFFPLWKLPKNALAR